MSAKYHTCGHCGATDGKVTCLGMLSDNPTLMCQVCGWRGDGSTPAREQNVLNDIKTEKSDQMIPGGSMKMATVYLTEGELNSLIHALGVVNVSVDGRARILRDNGIDVASLRQELVIIRDAVAIGILATT